jgi:hypothetical protein
MGFSLSDAFRGGGIFDPKSAAVGGIDQLGGSELGLFDPAGVLTGTGAAGGELGTSAQFLADPLDLFGIRANQTAEDIHNALVSSTRRGLDEQRRQLGEIERLNEPFRREALESALPSLRALATGEGETGFQPSRLFQLQKEQGQRDIRRQAAAAGKFGSTQRQEQEADLVSGLAREDLERFERGLLAQLQAGIGSTQALSAAGQTLGAAGAALHSNLGAQQNIAQQNLGAQRQASFQSAASGLGGLASLLNQPGVS